MRILLDECVPRRLRREFQAHDVRTVVEMGWSGKQNGELLSLLTPQNFDVFITVDQNISYQQSLSAAGIAIIVLAAHTNRVADLLQLAPATRTALDKIRPGEFVEVRRS